MRDGKQRAKIGEPRKDYQPTVNHAWETMRALLQTILIYFGWQAGGRGRKKLERQAMNTIAMLFRQLRKDPGVTDV
jgi:hypothetical protein